MKDMLGNIIRVGDSVFIATSQKKIVKGSVISVYNEELGIVDVETINNRYSRVWVKDILLDQTHLVKLRK